MYKNTDWSVAKFIHYSQNEFSKSKHGVFVKLSNIYIDHRPEALITDVGKVDIYKCRFNLVDGKESPRLEIIDITLWIIVRFKKESCSEGYSNCRTLVDFVYNK
jgi:hypothetical protein